MNSACFTPAIFFTSPLTCPGPLSATRPKTRKGPKGSKAPASSAVQIGPQNPAKPLQMSAHAQNGPPLAPWAAPQCPVTPKTVSWCIGPPKNFQAALGFFSPLSTPFGRTWKGDHKPAKRAFKYCGRHPKKSRGLEDVFPAPSDTDFQGHGGGKQLALGAPGFPFRKGPELYGPPPAPPAGPSGVPAYLARVPPTLTSPPFFKWAPILPRPGGVWGPKKAFKAPHACGAVPMGPQPFAATTGSDPETARPPGVFPPQTPTDPQDFSVAPHNFSRKCSLPSLGPHLDGWCACSCAPCAGLLPFFAISSPILASMGSDPGAPLGHNAGGKPQVTLPPDKTYKRAKQSFPAPKGDPPSFSQEGHPNASLLACSSAPLLQPVAQVSRSLHVFHMPRSPFLC
ncbi:nascent polypeptide-associated complex subunit alpha, muscle-specific form-like [Penaeus monodon]|uniref:nascent polypeptide-associated complex subunit alpha, muscle-specific form-like n=1 Tax=Penaeus monodon TaxID=6687 RepID=UPI0018A7E0DD|nr:nascent polypeptide-associated complex subunit alpha, muscle-specific form-like [Penaeus monodon]